MKIQPTDNINFKVYKGYKPTRYGEHIWGQYKGLNIDIYRDKKDNVKLFYVSDSLRNWIKSKLIYFQNGIKKVTRSENNAKNDRLGL